MKTVLVLVCLTAFILSLFAYYQTIKCQQKFPVSVPCNYSKFNHPVILVYSDNCTEEQIIHFVREKWCFYNDYSGCIIKLVEGGTGNGGRHN